MYNLLANRNAQHRSFWRWELPRCPIIDGQGVRSSYGFFCSRRTAAHSLHRHSK